VTTRRHARTKYHLTWDVLDRREVPAALPLFGAGSALANAISSGILPGLGAGNALTTGTANLANGTTLANTLNIPFANGLGVLRGTGLGASLLGNGLSTSLLGNGLGTGASLLGNGLGTTAVTNTLGGLTTARTLPFFGGLNNAVNPFAGGLNGALSASSLGGLINNLGLNGAFAQSLSSPTLNSGLGTTGTAASLLGNNLAAGNLLGGSSLLNTGSTLGVNGLSTLGALNSVFSNGLTTTGTAASPLASLLASGLFGNSANTLLTNTSTTATTAPETLTGNIPYSEAALTGNVPFTGGLATTGIGTTGLNGLGTNFSAGAFTPALPVVTADPSLVNGLGSGLFHPGAFGASGLNGTFSVPTTSAVSTLNTGSLFI
jgi:hypothetical protein